MLPTSLRVHRALQVLSWSEARLQRCLLTIVEEIQPEAPGSPENARSREHTTMENRCLGHDQCKQVIPAESDLHTGIITSSTDPFLPRKILVYIEDSWCCHPFYSFPFASFSLSFIQEKLRSPFLGRSDKGINSTDVPEIRC